MSVQRTGKSLEFRVFGLLGIKKDRKIVSPRSASHPLPVINMHICQGSSNISDRCISYRRLHDEGYTHLTVNRRECFVDPITGAHTKPWATLGNVQINYVETKRKPYTIYPERSLRCYWADHWECFSMTYEKNIRCETNFGLIFLSFFVCWFIAL